MLTADELRRLPLLNSCHFGLETFQPVTGNPGELSNGTEDINLFNPPANFSWDPYLDAMAAIGSAGGYLTTKHVGGFCLLAEHRASGAIRVGDRLGRQLWIARSGQGTCSTGSARVACTRCTTSRCSTPI
jgi:hypothetical protein